MVRYAAVLLRLGFSGVTALTLVVSSSMTSTMSSPSTLGGRLLSRMLMLIDSRTGATTGTGPGLGGRVVAGLLSGRRTVSVMMMRSDRTRGEASRSRMGGTSVLLLSDRDGAMISTVSLGSGSRRLRLR